MAINIVKEAAKSLSTMPILIFTPVVQLVGVVLFLIPWFIYVVYLASSGDMKTDETTGFRSFEYSQNTKYAFLYMVR